MGEYNLTPADINAVTGNNNCAHGYPYPVYSGGSGGFGNGFGGDWAWIIVLFLLFGLGGAGFGGAGFGGRGLTQVELQQGFDTQEITRKLDGLTNGLSDGFYAMNNTMMTGFTGVQRDVLTGFAGVGSQIADARYAQQLCCCETQRAIDGVKYAGAQNTCDITTAIHAEGEATRAMLTAQENARLHDELCQARSAISDYNQSQYILGQIGRYYTNPPCAGPVQYSYRNDCGCGCN